MPDGSPLQVTLLQPRSAPRPRGDAGSCSLGLIAGQTRELFGESRPRMRTLGGADFQTAGLRVCLPGNSHAGSAKVLSRRRRKRPEDRLADPKGVFANRAEVLRPGPAPNSSSVVKFGTGRGEMAQPPFLAKSRVEAGVSTMPHGNPITNQAPSSSEGRGALRRRVLPTHLGLITHNHSHQTPSSHQLLLAKAETWRGPILLRSKQPLVLTLFVAEGGGRSLLVPARLSQPPRGSGQAPGVFIAIPIPAKRLRHWRGGGCAL